MTLPVNHNGTISVAPQDLVTLVRTYWPYTATQDAARKVAEGASHAELSATVMKAQAEQQLLLRMAAELGGESVLAELLGDLRPGEIQYAEED